MHAEMHCYGFFLKFGANEPLYTLLYHAVNAIEHQLKMEWVKFAII